MTCLEVTWSNNSEVPQILFCHHLRGLDDGGVTYSETTCGWVVFALASALTLKQTAEPSGL